MVTCTFYEIYLKNVYLNVHGSRIRASENFVLFCKYLEESLYLKTIILTKIRVTVSYIDAKRRVHEGFYTVCFSKFHKYYLPHFWELIKPKLLDLYI